MNDEHPTTSHLESVMSASSEDVLKEAVALGERAAEVGFDWPNAREALNKVSEEVIEIKEVLDASSYDEAALRGELGDVLFAVCMVARLGGVDPGAALAETNAKFRRRFAFIERELLRRGIELGEASLEQMEEIWQASKHQPLP